MLHPHIFHFRLTLDQPCSLLIYRRTGSVYVPDEDQGSLMGKGHGCTYNVGTRVCGHHHRDTYSNYLRSQKMNNE